MLLGAGELGKEFVIAAKRYGQYVIAIDNYEGAPAMQVADTWAKINMLNGDELDEVVQKFQPDIIVPEIEAIRTDRFYDYEKAGIHVVPSAKAANFTMNRKAIRELAAKQLNLKTARYAYANNLNELHEAVSRIGMPCVVKPLMSSSGKGQSVIKNEQDIKMAWDYATSNARGDIQEVIVEVFIKFYAEITLLTVTQSNSETLFCPPIGHRQERGDYMESWQPTPVSEKKLQEAQSMAKAITHELGGFGIWGVEFFLTDEGVYFSELSPRPHDTGMITLANTQNFNEFELHLRAILQLPIPEITLEKYAANAVVLATDFNTKPPTYSGLAEAASIPNADFRIFGKPSTRPYRRMGIALAQGKMNSDIQHLRKVATQIAQNIKVNPTKISIDDI